MKTLTIHEYPVEIKITADRGRVQIKRAFCHDVLDGVAATFWWDIHLWLDALSDKKKALWEGHPVFVLYHGGSQFPRYFTTWTKGYEGFVHVINLDRGKNE